MQAQAKFGRRDKNTVTPSKKYFNVGYRKMRADDMEGAIDGFKQSIYFARNGYAPKANYWLGICYLNLKDFKLAEQSLRRAVSQSVEKMPDAWLAIAECMIRTNKPYLDVHKTLGKARMEGAKSEQVSYLYGLRADQHNKPMLAMGHYQRALGRKPWKWTKVWVKYAECKMKAKKWREAAREFNAILTTDYPLKNEPLGRIHHDIGVCKLALGDHQGAIDHWKRALDYDRDNREVWMQMGMLFENERHYSSAIKYYKQFLRICSGDKRFKDPRLHQVQQRVIKLEHMLKPNETAPEITKPSPYMRQQTGERMQTEYRKQQQRDRIIKQQQKMNQDSGF